MLSKVTLHLIDQFVNNLLRNNDNVFYCVNGYN